MRKLALLFSCVVACHKSPPLVGKFEGEAKVRAAITHDGKLSLGKEERHSGVHATGRTTNDDEAFPKFSMTLEGAPFTAPCTLKADFALPTEAVFRSDACSVKTESFEGTVPLTGALKVDAADELAGKLFGDTTSKGDAVSFHFDFRAKRASR